MKSKKNLIPSGSGKLKNPGILRSHSKPVIWSFLQGHCPEVTSQMKLADPSSLQLHSENKFKTNYISKNKFKNKLHI